MVQRGVVGEAMRAYYDRRAAEYDDWWLGAGLFARRERPGWDAEVAAVLAAVAGLGARRWLDVACGTGFVTRHLAGDVTGLDQSPAMVERCAARLPGGRVVHGDAVPLPFADGAFDAVFTANFYGHLLADERAPFQAEGRRVAPALVVLDAALRPGGVDEEWQERKLDDGSRHRVYKRFFRPEGLAAEIGGGRVVHAGHWFVLVTTP